MCVYIYLARISYGMPAVTRFFFYLSPDALIIYSRDDSSSNIEINRKLSDPLAASLVILNFVFFCAENKNASRENPAAINFMHDTKLVNLTLL